MVLEVEPAAAAEADLAAVVLAVEPVTAATPVVVAEQAAALEGEPAVVLGAEEAPAEAAVPQVADPEPVVALGAVVAPAAVPADPPQQLQVSTST